MKSHGTTHVVLVAHSGCGHYAERYPTRSERERFTQQLEDLAAARAALLAEHPKLQVAAYFAEPANGRVTFRKL